MRIKSWMMAGVALSAMAGAGEFAVPSAQAMGARQPSLEVTLGGTQNGYVLPRHAFCARDAAGTLGNGGNVSPAIRWEAGPAGTKSYALIMVDPDVPQDFSHANQQGKTIPHDAPRRDFFHWLLADIPANVTSLPEGVDSRGITKRGKAPEKTAYGVRGTNDYTHFMSGKMKGTYAGYDGNCPPWNDARVHNYRFEVYALDVPSVQLKPGFSGEALRKAIAPHVLAKGEATARYSLKE